MNAGAEQSSESPTTNDDAVDERKEPDGAFTIVGVGASAGGLEAFTLLLRTLSVDTGMAFVLVPHLSPTHASAMAEILSRATEMPVTEVHDEPRVQPNHVYVIPPGRNMVVSQGALHLFPREPRGTPRPIDQFFRSLAETRRHLAIGVVLSGTGSDGTIGLEAIKAEGGITFAQDDTAQQQGMPHSAVASGCVDFVLPPDAIAREIARIAQHPYTVPRAEARKPEPDLTQVVQLLRRATGVDFTDYKYSTLHRRVTRRMLLQKQDELAEYARFLETTPTELEALYQDILISVTRFFRDPEAIEALKESAFPRLINGRARHEPVRVWTIGCSTGQEAYSLAMAWAEFAETAKSEVPLQVFASDLNGSAVSIARAGVYPKGIAEDVSPERLQRFFVEVDGSYRISREIRESCIFSRHNVLADPPFSRIDLISCRNLLIYLEPVLQQRIMPTLHYALKPGGVLWLGSSETIGAFRNLFDVENVKEKIYIKKPGSIAHSGSFPVKHGVATLGGSKLAPPRQIGGGNDLHREADRLLLSKFAPPSVLVSADLDILQFRGDTGNYLAPAPGKASLNLLKMLREGLVGGVRSAILRAAKEQTLVLAEDLRVKSDGGYREVAVEVIPVKSGDGGEAAQGGFLVLFYEADRAPGESARPATRELSVAEQDKVSLTQELADTRDYLQAVIEQQETANEELQSANEDVQSANEELQSINEELETSKEELQSSNEELATVNDELNNRNAQLGQLNNDLVNLIGSIQTPIVMLGSDLRIRRFTPAAEKLFNLVPADVGRPMAAIKLKFDLSDLEPLLREVLDTASIQQREVRDATGRWYSLWLRPYRTVENKLDGVVLMLLDVDLIKRAHEYTKSIVETVREPLVVLAANLRIRTANESFYETFQCKPQDTEGRLIYELGDGQWNIPRLRLLLEDVLSRNTTFEDFEVEHHSEQIGAKTMLLNARRLVQTIDNEASILLAIQDVTERKRTDHQLQQHTADVAEASRHKDEFLAMLGHELRNPLAPILSALEVMRLRDVQDPSLKWAVDAIDRQAKNLARLVDDLLDVSRMTRGRIELRKENVSLAGIVQQAVEISRPIIESRRQQLVVSLPSSDVVLEADPVRLAQVFANLLNNAAKYTEPGGSIWLTAEAQSQKVIISVRDNGIGISSKLLPNVFEIFIQDPRALDRSQGGLGIGLTIVRSLIQLHGGAVEARSPGHGLGSEFIISLPIPEQSSAASPEPILHAVPSLFRLRVLVVDDNVDSAIAMGQLLELWGHEVQAVHDGETAVEAAMSWEPAVVLLDLGLPGMDGFAVAQALRASDQHGKLLLVAVTGYGQDQDRQRTQDAGFDLHLTKPVNLDKLRHLLATLRPPEGPQGTVRQEQPVESTDQP